MNLVTVIWSMIASACLILAAMNLLVWLKKLTARANLMIFVMAAVTVWIAYLELSMMFAGTPEAYGRSLRWIQLPIWLLIVSLVLFIQQYLRAGRLWLAWTVCSLRTLSLILNFIFTPGLHYREIVSLDHVSFLGEAISVAKGVTNPWMLTAQLSTILLATFAVDATVAIYRRGGSRSEVWMSCATTLFIVSSMVQSWIVFWWRIPMPITISFFSLGLVAVIVYEMSRDVLRAAQLTDDLLKSEAALRTSKKDLQQLAGRLISAQEEELRRLSRELHDDLTQRLAVIAIEAGKLEISLRGMPDHSAGSTDTVVRIKEQIIRISEDVHTMSRQIHPTILDDLGLVRAIESECAVVMGRHPVEITFRKENVPDGIPNDIALCLYRVIQEGLRNVTTHSEAKKCMIFLKGDDHTLNLTVSDDGIGFDPVEVRRIPGIGISSMRERVQLIQGEFSVKSRPGEGAVITVRVPLDGVAA